MKKNHPLYAILLSIALLSVPLIQAKEHHHRPYHAYFKEEVLNLTDEQKQSLKLLREEAKKKYRQLKQSKADFKKVKPTPADENYIDQVRKHAQNKADSAVKKAVIKAEFKQAMFLLLDTEQQEKWLKLQSFKNKQPK